MSIKPKEAEKLLQDHVAWVGKWHHEWRHHRNAAEDRFWDHDRTSAQSVWPVQGQHIVVSGDTGEGHPDIFPTEVNLVRPWETSFLASLYYDGIRFIVEPDELPHKGEKDTERLARSQAIRNLLNRFFSNPAVDDGTERLFIYGLRYRGGAATKLSLIPEHERGKDAKATEIVRFEAVPPWECVWDRRARTTQEARYRGHLFPVAIERLRTIFGSKIPQDLEGEPLPDVVEHGYTTPQANEAQERDASYAHLFILDDLTDVTEIEGEEEGIAGARTIFLATDLSANPKLTELKTGPTPYQAYNGHPLSELVPFLAEPRAEWPMDAIAPVATVYELNSELNKAQSIAAGAMRRDAVRIIMASDEVSDELRDSISNARDLEVLKTELPAGALDNSVRVLEFQPITGSLLEYLSMVRNGLQESQITADVTRGQAGQYLSATEAAQLVQFSETTIGRYRKRSDVMLGPGVGQLYLRVLQAAMKETGEKSIPVRVTGIQDMETYDVTLADLDRRWRITVIETASSPNAAAQKLAEFQLALPEMLNLAALADPPDPVAEGEVPQPSGMQQSLARAGYDHIVELLNLPGQFDADALIAAAPEPPPQPPPPELPEVGAAALPPVEDTAQLAQSPAAQAILEQGEVEQGL